MEHYLLRDLFITVNKAKRYLDNMHRRNGIFLGQARVLRYVYQNRDHDLYQKDVEKHFQIRGGSVSELLDSLVKSKYLKRVELSDDKRMKKLILTPKGMEKAIEATNVIIGFEDSIKEVLSNEQIDMFHAIIRKINQLMDEKEQLI